ncbi:MAG: hypothetical protein ACLPKW_19340, partial [Acetobacteraceae bacterium]
WRCTSTSRSPEASIDTERGSEITAIALAHGSYGRRHPCRFPLRTDELNPAAVRQRDRGDLAAAFGVDASFR